MSDVADVRLDEYHVDAITGGTNALVEVWVTMAMADRKVTARGAGTDIIMASVEAVLNGINLSSIFLVYDYGTLILAFLVGAVYFGVMAVYGNVTDRDLTGWGPKLMGGLVALIVCALMGSLLSMFGLNFGIADLLLCAVGLLIFMGLTAYDTQMLKYYYSYFGGDAAMLHKASIIGALNLYLDFINIFLYIVRMLGRRNND